MQITSLRFRQVVPHFDRIDTLVFEVDAINNEVKYTLLKTATESDGTSIRSYVDKPMIEKTRSITDEELIRIDDFVDKINFSEFSKEEIKKNGVNGEQSVIFSTAFNGTNDRMYKEVNIESKPSEWTELEKLYNYVNTAYPFDKKKRTFWNVKEL